MFSELSVAGYCGQRFPSSDPRLCRPAKGRSLGATVEQARKTIDEAVELLIGGFLPEAAHTALFCCLKSRELYGAISEPAAQRLAWFAVNVTLLHAISRRAVQLSPLTETIPWFFGQNEGLKNSLLGAFECSAMQRADAVLSSTCIDQGFIDLLPYILEPHGHVTRGKLERDADAAVTRGKKRDAGVYYTPSDVAEFMVRELAQSAHAGSWIDPACGTAIFLREVLRYARHADSRLNSVSFCRSSLYGLDISPLATESAIFVLLIECALRADSRQNSSWDLWLELARNIRACDATSIQIRQQRCSLALLPNAERIELAELFPETGGHFDRLVMNPPYSDLVVTPARASTWDSLRGMPTATKVNATAVFVEMMWQFTKAQGQACAVLPLSIGTSSHKEYVGCRLAILESGGRWDFLFFDREPHALFGEDIKTRNAVVFRTGGPQKADIHTSRLLKWTSSLRSTIFTRSRTTPIATRDMARFIPKLGGAVEATLYEVVEKARRAKQDVPHIARTVLADIKALDSDHTVLVSASAYNFLNVFLPGGLEDVQHDDFSTSSLHALTFGRQDERDRAFAVLTSRLAFWLWHVEGDGFHVTSRFLRELPLWVPRISERDERLADLGRQVWLRARVTRTRSLNGGKATYSFHCPFSTEEIEKIDEILLFALQAPAESANAIAEFVSNITSIDGKERRRKPLNQQELLEQR